MASVSSVGSSSSSIYGTRNVISGLASGIDTETLIENAVSGYQLKISNLQQKRTKVEWQQEAYRSIIAKMSAFTDKYTSYMSATNLMSTAFFDSAVKVSTAGAYADKISASGRTNSDVQILGVKQLAKSAIYTVSGLTGGSGDLPSISGEQINLKEKQPLSNLSGSLTINYGGGRSYTVDFGELDIYSSADELAKAIDEKLGEQTMTLSDGTMVDANTRIGVRVNGESIEFYDKGGAGNNVYISSASGDIKKTLGLTPSESTKSLDLSGVELVNEDGTVGDYLSGKELTVTLDGVTKKITLPDYRKADGHTWTNVEYLDELQKRLDDSFGAGKITVDRNSVSGRDAFSLKLTTQKGSTMAVSGNAAEAIGLGSGASTYVDTSQTLGDILKDADWGKFTLTKAEGEVKKIDVEATEDTPAYSYYVDSKGHKVAKSYDDGQYYRVDDKGEFLYEFKVNDQVVGSFSKNTALESVLTAINGNADVGVTVNYSKTTNQFQFVAKESGAAGRVEMGDGLASALFGGGTEEKGQDAILSMSVNGQILEDITRSSNTFNVDGLSVNLKGTFNYAETDVTDESGKVITAAGTLVEDPEAVTFTSTSDADKVVDAIRSMVEDYNAMVTEIKNAYSTLPAQKSSGAYYEPLTDKDMEGMSESAIAAYEEKAKQGLLFGDSDLSALYSRLLNAVSMTGSDGAALKAAGITTAYSNGLTTLTLDETTLRATLETDPDKVRDIFTKSTESGASTNGLMQALKTPLDLYGKTTGGKGILVEKAGSPLASSTLYSNTIQTQLDALDQQIQKWQDKMSDQIDRYTAKFSALEQLVSEMNSQSSYFAGLMSGY
ncbi:flagellar hook-associated protein 2 [Pusillibacter faecalis]|uniref:Flagellar hook-associated protein 2 n=1 Tax=Pusillibacter faecalis TaxID=2714358 RepID=A0A810Q958_9FIRM|nr:flagellar filament capping protein FliD [Pusillibacter faecalis]BCK84740.1 flagellar hook-associated protein 2 [Pusillibacter faecalis]